MRVVYYYDTPIPSRFAATIQILNTCHALAKLGATVSVHAGPRVVADDRALWEWYGLEPHERLTIVHGRRARPARAILDAAGSRESAPADVLISRGETGLVLARRLRRRRPKVRFLYEVHRLCYTELAGFRRGHWLTLTRLPGAERRMRAAEQATIEGADGLLYLTAGVQAAVESNFRVACPTLILPSGTTLPPEEPPGDEHRDIDVLFVGKIERRKGASDLIAAMKYLPGRRLWIVGGSTEQVAALRQAAETAGVADQVEAVGFVEPARVPEYLRRARVGICPLPAGVSAISESYTSSLKILELLAHGVPVVATDVPSVREIVEHERTALLVEPNRPDALAAAIERVLENPSLVDHLRQAGRLRAADFSWDRRAARLLKFLRSLVSSTS